MAARSEWGRRITLREGASSEVAAGCDPAGGGGAVPADDTEERAQQHQLKPPLREFSAPPPRRPAPGRRLPSARGVTTGAPPAALAAALPDAPAAPPDALHDTLVTALPSPALRGPTDSEVERLWTENQGLRAALAAAELTIRELQAALAAAAARAQPANPVPAAQQAGGGAQQQEVPDKKDRSRRCHRPRGMRKQTVADEVGEEAQEPEEHVREEGQGDNAAAAGADPAPRPELLGEEAAEEQGAARPSTPWADEWEVQEEQEEELDAAPPQSTAVVSPPLGLPGKPRTAAPTPAAPEEPWLCSWCGVSNYCATNFCGSPECGRPRLWHVAPAEAHGVEQEQYYQQQVGMLIPQCAADFALALPSQRQPPPRSLPMLVPVTPACPPPVPEPAADARRAFGEALHPRVAGLCPARADMITGMLLELGPSYAQQLLTEPNLLASEVHEAWQTLVDAERPRGAKPATPAQPAAPAPAQAPAQPAPRYVPSYLRRRCAAAKPAALAPAAAPALPRGPQSKTYVAPYLRRRQRL